MTSRIIQLAAQARKKKHKKAHEGHIHHKALKPSERIHLDSAHDQLSGHLRPMISADAPFMYRVFNKTVQRVPLHYSSLSSWAAFIIVVDSEREAVGWYGQECKLDDRKLASELGLEVLKHDLRLHDAHSLPFTSEALENLKILRYILPKLWCDETTFHNKVTVDIRRKMCYNAPVSVGVLDKFMDGSYALREVAFSSVNEKGEVPRLPFVDIDLNTVAVVHYADQWDIWTARGCSKTEEELARVCVSKLANARASSSGAALTSAALDALTKGNPHVKVTKQGCERVLFRCHMKLLTDFEPPDKCIPWRPPIKGLLDDALEDVGVLGEQLGSIAIMDPFSRTAHAMQSAADVVTGVGGVFRGAVLDVFTIGHGGSSFEESAAGGGNGGQGPSEHSAPSGVHFEDVKDGDDGNAKAIPRGAPENRKVNALFRSFSSADARDHSHFGNSASFKGMGAPDSLLRAKDRVRSSLKPKGHPYEGRDMMTYAMMDFIDEQNLGPIQSNQLIEYAAYEPVLLVGYQIEIDEGLFRGRHVVTGTRKTAFFQKSMFRLSSFEAEDVWVKLKRKDKLGVPFRVLRRVMEGIDNECIVC